MEFTLGFFGGLGMVYAVLTREWPASVKPSRAGNWIALVFVFLFIPATNYFNGFSTDDFIRLAENLNISGAEQYAGRQFLYAGFSVLLFGITAILIWKSCSKGEDRALRYCIPALLLLTSLHYNLFSYIRLGTFYRPFSFAHSDSTYIFILILVFAVWYFSLRKTDGFPGKTKADDTWKRWGLILGGLLAIILIITLISINIHSGLPGSHDRF
jgi:hypothetical protein